MDVMRRHSRLHAQQQQPLRDEVTTQTVEHIVSQLGEAYHSEHVPFFGAASFYDDPGYIALKDSLRQQARDQYIARLAHIEDVSEELEEVVHIDVPEVARQEVMQGALQSTQNSSAYSDFSLRDTLALFSFTLQRWSVRTPVTVFAIMLVFALSIFGGTRFIGELFTLKGTVLGVSTQGYVHIQEAFTALRDKNFQQSQSSFAQAHAEFSRASSELDALNDILVHGSQYIPGAGQLHAGKHMVDAAKELTIAAEAFNALLADFSTLDNPFAKTFSSTGTSTHTRTSLLAFFSDAQKQMTVASEGLRTAQHSLDQIAVDDLPQEYRDQFIQIKTAVPTILSTLDTFTSNNDAVVDLLGGNGLRRYLFLFQNNQEARPTGGFIGSYGLLDMKGGNVEQFLIDGIYNPDGQLTEKIVPPRPLQKVSAAWSLHDSNWFSDFPISAQKAMLFYEKTGGPSVDGVITLTPQVMERLLAITGPITMEEYDVTLTSDNFVELTQYEVEEDYDKEDNRPKKILADLAPIVIAKVLSPDDFETTARVIDAFAQSLAQKQILLYMRNDALQDVVQQHGWAGRLRTAPHDYLSVVNTNINGFKTDGVIDESITHQSIIADDGTIENTVTITRTHNGGRTGREWWDRVNANYMRVYVPQGAELISAQGHTPEVIEPRLDYEALGFKRDTDVVRYEESMRAHEESGTHIYEESDKTVFGNWVYVSPQETVTVEYRYRLPFRLDLAGAMDGATAYSVLFQKQHGSRGSQLNAHITWPQHLHVPWHTNTAGTTLSGAADTDRALRVDTTLVHDYFTGIVFGQPDSDVHAMQAQQAQRQGSRQQTQEQPQQL